MLTRKLLSVQAGKPENLTTDGKTWRSAIFKTPLTGRVFVGTENIAGDKQANLRFHGGPQMAVCCFSSEYYPHWAARVGAGENFPFGALGENFTLVGSLDDEVCIGDVFEIGLAQVQVSQPRQPCINLARKWNCPEMPEEMIELGHMGFYLRVIKEGEVGAGDSMAMLARPNPDITIKTVIDAKFRKFGGGELASELVNLPELAETWQRTFGKRL